MIIATYNVWNEDKGIGGRYEQIIQEIVNTRADIIGLQEVTTKFYQYLTDQKLEYPYCDYRKYSDEDEGLAILSKYPIESCNFLHTNSEYANSKAMNIIFSTDNSRFSFTNVHLPCDSVREKVQFDEGRKQ